MEVTVPYIHYSEKSSWYNDITESSIGNIYLGFKKFYDYNPKHKMLLSIGANLPTNSSENVLLRVFAVFSNFRYFYYYLDHTYAVSFANRHFYHFKDQFKLSFQFGFDYMGKTKKNTETAKLTLTEVYQLEKGSAIYISKLNIIRFFI